MSNSYLLPGTNADGAQLWVVTVNADGTASATEINFYPGFSSADYSAFLDAGNPTLHGAYFTRFHGGFLFAARGVADNATGVPSALGAGSTQVGRELWYTNGTVAGTHVIGDIATGTYVYNGKTVGNASLQAGISPQTTVLANGTALFVARTDATNPHQGLLFSTDGTFGSFTRLVGNKASLYGDLYGVTNLGTLNGTAVFAASVSKSSAPPNSYLFTTDGTNKNTTPFLGEKAVSFLTSTKDGGIENLFVGAGGAQTEFFTGADSQLWATTGKSETKLTTGLSSDSQIGITSTTSIADLGVGKALFFAGPDLWITDGASAGGTSLVKAGLGGKGIQSFHGTSGAEEGFFTVKTSTTYQLWITDGTAGGTTLIDTSTTDTQTFQPISGHLLFVSTDSQGYKHISSNDGTATGTQSLAQGNTFFTLASVIGIGVGPAGMASVDVTYQDNSSTLFITDGTAAGTHAITKYGSVQSQMAVGNKLFVVVQDPIGNSYLYVDVAGSSGLATKLNLGTDVTPTIQGVLGSELLFTATTLNKGTESWVTDGTQANTHVVSGGAYLVGTVNNTPTVAALPCFLAGTRLRTPEGEVAVEALAAGDRVLTHRGRAAPIAWVGRGPFDVAAHPRPHEVAPIRIRQDALDDGVPTRDLLVSPGHSLLIDGVLMQAERLVNGATILRDPDIGAGTYYHVELDRHDIVVSDGAASESYLDTGNRGAFVNGGGVADLHPNFAPRDASQTCLPLVTDGPALVAARARLIARAQALGWRRLAAVDCRVIADDRVLTAIDSDARWSVFAVPAGVTALRLRSDAVLAGEVVPELDRRRLGVMLAGIAVVRGRTRREVALGDAMLRDGWHEVEQHDGADWRWTDGDAGLAIEGPCLLELAIERGLGQWQYAAPVPAAARTARSRRPVGARKG